MKLKNRFLIAAITAACLWWMYVVIHIAYRRGHTKALPQVRLFVYNASKWGNCALPTDTQHLCSRNATPAPPCALEELSQDCALLKYLHGYDKPVDEEELNFPLAFGIKMHTAPEQAEQLLRTIYRPHNVYCIHVDKQASQKVYRVMASIATCFPNVYMSRRIRYVYRSYENVRSELRTMACALESGVEWKYYLNMAGQAFPLKTNLEIVRILQILNGTNDIESFPAPKSERNRFSYKHNISNGKIFRTSFKKGPPPFEISIRKGSQYNAFSRAFVTTIFYDDDAVSIRDYFKDGSCPEENVWATLNYLPWIPGGYQVNLEHSPNNQHITTAVAWKGSDPYFCKGRYIRKVCIFTQDDLPWLLQLPNIFVNKFRFEVDSRPAACLEAVLDQRVRSRVLSINQSYYEKLPHVKYRREHGFSTAEKD